MSRDTGLEGVRGSICPVRSAHTFSLCLAIKIALRVKQRAMEGISS